MEHYNSKIQMDINVIKDIVATTKNDTKMLVFGLGYDSKLWYSNNNNTYFVEDKDEYISLNKDIPSSHIIKYSYNTTCKDSVNLDDTALSRYSVPEELMKHAPFDIILIDGPEGWSDKTPGRIIPFYWSSILSKKGSIVYADDCSRPLESYCINKFYKCNQKHHFEGRLGCMKISI